VQYIVNELELRVRNDRQQSSLKSKTSTW